MKLKIKDQIPDIEIFHLVDGEPQTSKIRDILGKGKVVFKKTKSDRTFVSVKPN